VIALRSLAEAITQVSKTSTKKFRFCKLAATLRFPALLRRLSYGEILFVTDELIFSSLKKQP
jgi:hypothetical protein